MSYQSNIGIGWYAPCRLASAYCQIRWSVVSYVKSHFSPTETVRKSPCLRMLGPFQRMCVPALHKGALRIEGDKNANPQCSVR